MIWLVFPGGKIYPTLECMAPLSYLHLCLYTSTVSLLYLDEPTKYCLESINISNSDLKTLEIKHRKFIQSILTQPQPMATLALYVLTVTLPLEAMIDYQRLSLLRNVIS